MRIAYIANGALWLQDGAGAPREIVSQFARQAEERASKAAKVNAWKHADRDEQRGIIPGSMLWRSRGAAAGPLAPPRFEHVVAGADPDVLYYVLSIGSTNGLFEYRISEDREIRILHSADFSCQGLAFDRASGQLLISRAGNDGRVHLQALDTQGNSRGMITGGDCQDLAPALVANDPGGIYFQSSGLALHPNQGYVVAMAPAVVSRFDRKSAQVTTLVEHAERDCLSPRPDGRGNLFYIRRPYAKPFEASATDQLKDVLLFPWRLLKAIFGYLNFFSMIYGKEPLKSAGGPRNPLLDQDLGTLWLHGRMIELSKVRYDAGRGGGLVPDSWQLVRRGADNVEAVVASNVASFDIAEDGTVVYTNGFDIRAFPDRANRPIGRGELVQRVSVLA